MTLYYLLSSLDVVCTISASPTETAAKAWYCGSSSSVGHDHLLLHAPLHRGHDVVASVLIH